MTRNEPLWANVLADDSLIQNTQSSIQNSQKSSIDISRNWP